MKQLLITISLVVSLLVTGWAQSNFVVAGNSGFSVGQIFASDNLADSNNIKYV